MRDRRHWLAAIVALSIAIANSWRAGSVSDRSVPGLRSLTLPARQVHIDDPAVASGIAYLVKQQSPDGAWRSDRYATFKDGTALTPLVVCALQEAGGSPDAIRKGCEFLAKSIPVGDEGTLDYPAYTAALSVTALSRELRRDPELRKARDAWLKYLLERQLTEKLGWKPEDREFGGWGYCRFIPKKPVPGAIAPPLIESNLSATVFALDALREAGVRDEAVYKKALVFVRSCQNYASPLACIYIPELDGGFHFMYGDPVRNKAGAVPTMGDQPPSAFRSYGSATADGYRALNCFIDKADDFRRGEAKTWLTAYFKPDSHPGKYIPTHEGNREAVYYYYAASVAKALRLAKVEKAGGKPWAQALAAELRRRQRKDGSWANPVELVREDEPLVATANAVVALSHCK
ncbi:MAG TPA: prenyltransferase/squalene oxidase repeat-containing protein [Urbifossiella sp.]|nr:prenyltransferase/squalene oxidase repeat-containing protein [Urbifossiella sp.]